jgi:serine/alanine adding enzyme
MRISIQIAQDDRVWDEYVDSHSRSSTYHRWRWRRVITETYPEHRPHYLQAVDSERVCGVLPLIEMKSRLFGHFLVSLPFFNYGGVLADDDLLASALLEEASQLAARLGAAYVELRQGENKLPLGWQEVAAKVAMVTPVLETPEAMMKSLGSRLRNKIKHAHKHGLVCKWGKAEAVRDFYPVFAENMRNLGTPVYPRSWFENVMRHNPDATIMTVFDSGACVAATLIVVYRENVELPWIASTPTGRKHYSTALLYWEALAWAIQNNCKNVDFGRCTPGSGTYQFKQQWNPKEIPLSWYYWLAPGVALPELRPTNPKYKLAVAAWQRLPLAVANRIGPWIVRNIP